MKKFLFPKKLDWLLIKLWWPIFLQLFMLPIFGWINNAFVGRLGTAQLAGTAIGYNFLNAAMGLFFFLSIVTTSSVSYYKGAKKHIDAMEASLDGLIIAAVLGIITTLLLELFLPQIVGLFDTDDIVKKYAIEFSRTWTIALTPIMIIWAAQGILKGLQKVKIITKVTIVSILLEIILNVFFLFVFKTGIKGLGYGCTIANVIADILLLIPIIKEIKKSGLKKYTFKLKYIKGFIFDSIPLAIRSACIWIVVLISTFAVANLGEVYIAAMQICDSILGFTMFTFDALAAASQTLVGESLGAAKPKRTVKIIDRTKRIALIFITPVAIALVVLSYVVPKFTTTNIRVLHLVLFTCVIAVLTMPLQALTFSYDGIINGFKEYKFLMIASLISMIIGGAAMILSMHIIDSVLIRFLFVYTGYDVFFILPRFLFNHYKIKKLRKSML